MADFPSDLPDVMLKGHAFSSVSNVARTEMEDGYIQARKRFTKVPKNYKVGWVLTETQLADFESWFNGDINYGMDVFNISLGGSTVEARFIDDVDVRAMTGAVFEVLSKLQVL